MGAAHEADAEGAWGTQWIPESERLLWGSFLHQRIGHRERVEWAFRMCECTKVSLFANGFSKKSQSVEAGVPDPFSLIIMTFVPLSDVLR